MSTLKLKINRKDLPVHGLDKIPDEVIIEKLRVELGQNNSYIDELESKIKALKKEHTESYTGKLENDIKSLKASLKKLRDESKIETYEKKIMSQKKEILNLKQTVSQLVANNLKPKI